MYCLQDLQLSCPVKVGLMYCLQDLQLRWPVKAIWRGRSLLTAFNFSTVTKLRVPAYCCSTVPHHTCRTAADWRGITVLFFPSQTACELQLMDNSVFRLEWTVLLLCSHSSTDRAVTKLRLSEIFIDTGDKAAMPTNSTAGYRGTGFHPTTPRLLPTQRLLAPSLLKHIQDAQVCNLVT